MAKPTWIAPRWHTALLVGLYVSVAALGTLLTAHGASVRAPAGSKLTAVYLPMVLVQGAIAFYVTRVGRTQNALVALLGAPWSSPRRALTDLSLAALVWGAIKTVELVWSRAFASTAPAAVTAMLPHTALECLAWAGVSATVGFGEELIFRGYLQRQFGAYTGRAWVAVLLQAALFGLAHAEQGPGAIARTALYGVLFGTLAHARKSLAPGIVAHVWTDFASGVLRV